MATPMENVFSNSFQSFLAGDSVLELRELVSIIETNNLITNEKQSSIQEALGHIHTCLTSSKKRPEGLLLLNTIVDQSSTEIFQHNAITWINLLSQILQSHNAGQVTRTSVQILCRIISHARSFADLSREITSSVIPQLLPLLLSFPPDLREIALTCISTCIKHFPGPVGPFKGKIEKLVLGELERGANSQQVSRCFALLAQCGPGGAQGVKHSEAWASQCSRVLASLGQTLGGLYEGLESDASSSSDSSAEFLPLNVITRDSSDRVASLCSRWKALTGCLQSLLREDLSASVKIPTDAIVRLVCRCLSVNCNMLLSRPTTERMLLAAFLQDVHICALQVLESLITGCRTVLVPYAAIVVEILTQELVWTQTPHNGHNSQYGPLRSAVYRVLSLWMKVCGGMSGVLSEEKALIKQLIHDCTPVSEMVQVSSSGTAAKADGEPSNKKKKKKGYQEITQGTSSQKKTHPLANSQLVECAHEVLYWMVTICGPEMNKKLIQEVQSFTVTTLLSLQHGMGYPVPYSSPECRQGLYRLLQALVLSQHPGAPSPLQCAAAILGTGRLDTNIQVSAFCTEALHICESIIHPRVPCLNGPIICENLVTIGSQSELCQNSQGIGKNDKHGNIIVNGEQGVSLDLQRSHLSKSNAKKRTFEEESEDAESDEVMVTKVARVEEVRTNDNGKKTDNGQMGASSNIVNMQRISIDSEGQDSPKPGTSRSDMFEADITVVSDESDGDSDLENELDQSESNIVDRMKKSSKDALEKDVIQMTVDADEKTETTVINVIELSNGSSNDGADDEDVKAVISSNDKEEKQEDIVEVGAMLAAFVDASPDSD